MRILALDCTAKSVAVAIAEDGVLIAEGFLHIRLTHSETLLPLCTQVLQNARLSLKDIDAIAVTAGPGSFTGVRIGVSAAKGFAFAEEKPVYPFSTLYAMALAYAGLPGEQTILCCLMDARCGQFYNAVFDLQSASPVRCCPDRIILADDLEKQLEKEYNNKNILLTGDGAALFYTLKGKNGRYTKAPAALIMQRAAGMALSASLPGCPVAPVSPHTLQPIYLRKSQAEREREQQNK